MAKNQRHVDKLKAKLKATLNQKNNDHGVTTPKPTGPAAAAAVHSTTKAAATAAAATVAIKSSVNPKVQKFNKKPTVVSNGAAATTNAQSQRTMKSAQSKQKQLPKVASNKNVEAAAPKVNQTDIPKKKPNVILSHTKNLKEPNRPIKIDKKMKKKKKEKNKKPNATVPVNEKQPHKNQPTQEGKRKFDQIKADTNTQAKRLKCDRNGFIERNIDSDVEIEVPHEMKPPKKTKKKKIKKSQNKIDECNGSSGMKDAAGPSVKVIHVDEDQSNGLDEHSDSGADSEADSYIDRFFRGDSNEFNENRIYSVDEIETEDRNFLAKASGERTNSDDDTSSSEGIPVYGSDSDSNSNSSNSIAEIESAKGQKIHTSNDLEKYSWSSGEDIDDSDYDDEDDDDDDEMNGDMFYGSDSDVSLGSAVDSDDLDDTYEGESTEESIDGYEMNSSYEDDSDDDEDGNSELDDSDHSNCSYSESHSSQDTYDEFLHSRHYESSNDDQDYNGEWLT